MSRFVSYARYYDLLYRDKNYVAEVDFVRKLLQFHAPDASSILELGCGTGKHAVMLAESGYQVWGVDLSADMLKLAIDLKSRLSSEVSANLDFHYGDLRSLQLDQTFDAIISLFHVFSYLSTNEEVIAALKTVKMHLKPDGIFLFDCWYGPAVLSDRPTVRVKRLEDDEIEVTRIAEPVMYPNQNLVDVNYHIFVRDKITSEIEELQETHRMRYFFLSEIEMMLEVLELKLIIAKEWMTDHDLGFDTWGAYFLVQT